MMTKQSTYHLEIFETVSALNKAAAEFMIAIARKSIAERGRFVISLSGGQTPKHLYALLADPLFSSLIDWENTYVFWGDERCVPLEDERNNAYEANQILLHKVAIPASNVYAIPVNLSPVNAAQEYEQTLRDFFGVEPMLFDLILLGLGKNGHTASLFPGTTLVKEQKEGIREVYVAEENMFRISMTAPLINHARHICFLVTGEDKASIVKEVLSISLQGFNYPAQLIKQSDGELYWFLDQAAASLLPA